MISKQQQNMAILDEELNFAQSTMDEMPTNLSLDKTQNCDNQMNQDQISTSSIKSSRCPTDNSSEKEKFDNGNKSKSVKTSGNDQVKDFTSETRIQLSFSVDRLLNKKTQSQSDAPEPKAMDTSCSDKCCEEVNNGYACCSLPNCMVNTANPTSLSFVANSFHNNDEDSQMSSPSNFVDFKSVVRPTPMRALGNNAEQGK